MSASGPQAESLSQRELRNESGRVLRVVSEGQSFVLTSRGGPVGRIVRLDGPRCVAADRSDCDAARSRRHPHLRPSTCGSGGRSGTRRHRSGHSGRQLVSADPAATGPERRLVRKVVAYVVREENLLVFTHDDVPLDIAGVQVPAGTIETGEDPAAAVVREVLEETGIAARIVRELGVEQYDVWPSKPELHERHFFQLVPADDALPDRWAAGEDYPSDGGVVQRWTCRWMPLEHGHVLCAGFGMKLGAIVPSHRSSGRNVAELRNRA
jgi:prevent-host-death family protein